MSTEETLVRMMALELNVNRTSLSNENKNRREEIMMKLRLSAV